MVPGSSGQCGPFSLGCKGGRVDTRATPDPADQLYFLPQLVLHEPLALADWAGVMSPDSIQPIRTYLVGLQNQGPYFWLEGGS